MTVDMHARRTSVSRTIPATPEEIFAVLSDASLHPVIDGSSMVKGTTGRIQPLALGTRFAMNMRMGILPYRITNEVVEFEPDRLIAWHHPGKHRWRFELEPTDGGTTVTETFDWSTSLAPKVIELVGYPKRHEANIERTLERLETFVTTTSSSL
jgi:uncharacterized protein YndB with AHSA1/START domain